MPLRSFPIVTTTKQVQATTHWNSATHWHVYLHKADAIYQKDGRLDHFPGSNRARYFSELTSHQGARSGRDAIDLAREQMGIRASSTNKSN